MPQFFARLPWRQPRVRSGFTLVELLVAVSIFSMLLLIFTSIIGIVYRAWDTSKRQTEISQNARAILSLIEQDLTPAVVSKVMQMGENPPELGSKMVVPEEAVPNSDSLFWWGPATGSTQPNQTVMAQFGWYLSQKPSPDGKGMQHNLNRFSRRFELNVAPIALATGADTPNNLHWFKLLGTAQDPMGVDSSLDQNARVVSSNVIGLWIECLDRNGVPIPPRVNDALKLRFNSAERFQMAPAGQRFSNNATFRYTDGTTLQAHLLPAFVRVSIMITDERSLQRVTALPSLPDIGDPVDVPMSIKTYRAELQEKGLNASVFTSTVKLANSL